jgi:integrase
MSPLLHYSLRTEEAYLYWCKAFIRFHGLRHPAEMGGPEVEAFLTHLAADRAVVGVQHTGRRCRRCCSSTARCWASSCRGCSEIGRPVPRRRLPTVLTPDEVAAVLARMSGVHGLLARLLYGTGCASPRACNCA